MQHESMGTLSLSLSHTRAEGSSNQLLEFCPIDFRGNDFEAVIVFRNQLYKPPPPLCAAQISVQKHCVQEENFFTVTFNGSTTHTSFHHTHSPPHNNTPVFVIPLEGKFPMVFCGNRWRIGAKLTQTSTEVCQFHETHRNVLPKRYAFRMKTGLTADSGTLATWRAFAA